MDFVDKIFEIAKTVALKEKDHKHYWFGAVGLRKDGKIVTSKNIRNAGKELNCHAEARLSRKLDKGSIVFVVRINKNGSKFLLARPCLGCQNKMKAAGVKIIYYSIDNHQYGIMTV